MGTDDAVVTNFHKHAQRGIHSNKNIIPDSDAMDNGAMADDDVISDDDICHACMDHTIVLNTAVAPDLNSESIRSQNRSRPNTGVSPDFYIANQIGILADKNRGVNLWFFLSKTFNHMPNLPLLSQKI
jgi:hypothetical protein